MQNVKIAARRAGLGFAVAGIAAVAAVAPASAYAPTVTGTQPATSAGFDASAAAASGWSYSWTTDASGATTYTYGDGSSSTTSAPASSVGAAAATSSAPAAPAAPAAGLSTQSVAKASSAVPASTSGITATAMSYQGAPYVWGGTTPGGWDCSGFVQYVYAQNGIELPRLAASQGAAGTPTSNPKPGDLVIQNGGSHVGIYLGNGMMISALNPGQGTQVHSVASMSTDYYASF